MGKLVNVVREDGKVVAIPAEDAARLSSAGVAQPETDQAAASRVLGAKNEARAEGFGQGIKAMLEGSADALTGGAYGKIAGAVSPDYAEELANRGEHRPGMRALGELGSFALPTGLPAAAGKLGRTVASQTGSKVLGRATEGAIIGAGGHVASTNVTGDPVTIEGTMLGMGVGSFLSVGFGAAADKVRKAGDKARTVGEEVAVVKADVTAVKRGRELFEKNPNGWDGFQESVKSVVTDERKAFGAAETAARKYQTFAKDKLPKEITKTEAAINKISARWKTDDGVQAAAVDESLPIHVRQRAKSAAKPERQKDPASEEMKVALKEWRDRLRRVDQLRTGGFDVDASAKAGRWIKSDAPADPARAVEELRALRAELEAGRKLPDGKVIGPFPDATRKSNWASIPDPPPKVAGPPESVKVPKSLLELARMEPASVEKLSNAVAKNPAARDAFNKLSAELGTDAADSVAGLHSKLKKKYIEANERLTAMARKEAEDAGGGFLGTLRRGANKFIHYGSARAADSALGFGWKGSLGRVMAGEGSQAAMSATEDFVSGAMMQGKLGLKQTVAKIVEKTSKPTARALDELGPITAYLSGKFLTGEAEDGEPEDLAVKRIAEVMQTATTAPDASFVAVQALLGHPSDAAAKLSQKAVGDLNYLVQNAPKDPGIAFHGFKSEWRPSADEALAFAYRIEAVVDPLKAIMRTISGDGHPAATEALWERWPALMQTAADEFVFALHDADELDRDTASHYSDLFRTPITGLKTPEVMLTLQGMYLPKPEEGALVDVNPTGRAVGRPARYDSVVAGSSVSGLLAQ